jgi:hypothetical protein
VVTSIFDECWRKKFWSPLRCALIKCFHPCHVLSCQAAHRLLVLLLLRAGDVLRGVTCTNFVYPTRALFGAVPPQRHVVSQHTLLPQHKEQ